MSRSLAFIVVAVLLCIILSSQAIEGLQCRGDRLRNGTFFFNASYEVEEDVRDCETQWLVDDKLAGLSEADGNTKVMLPIIMATANTASLLTCPKKLQWLLICPSGNINKKEQCLCDTTPRTTLPEVVAVLNTTPPTVLEVGFPYWIIGVLIGGASGLVIIVTVVHCMNKRRLGYACGRKGSAEELPV